MSDALQRFLKKHAELSDLHDAAAILSWDLEVHAPPKAAEARGRQLATLSGLAHDAFVSDEMGELLEQLKKDEALDPVQQGNVRVVAKDYDKARKFDRAFVERQSQVRTKAYGAWMKAREANDFGHYVEALEAMFALKREEAERLGYQEHPYDALMDAYEPGARTSVLRPLFEGVREQLVDFVAAIAERPSPEGGFLQGHFPHQAQWDFGLDVLKSMGYDFDAGRQDISEHPFTIGMGPLDTRVTTRVDEGNFRDMLWSCIHEGGHALYDQGLPAGQYGLPAGQAASLGIHESQSRLWENNVGRSLSFWKHWYPKLQGVFPDAFGEVALDDFYRAINTVQPSLIRTEADELTYHFHVAIRFEIEAGLVEGSLAVKDLRDIWNDRYKKYLGVEVPDDKQGVLQDIHWSHGSIGYFATYSLGSFYAVQLFNAASMAMPGLQQDIESGRYEGLLKWLQENVHAHGRLLTSEEICEKATGSRLDFAHFMAYAKEKYGAIYGL
jgi:carboxypeptidase Taq